MFCDEYNREMNKRQLDKNKNKHKSLYRLILIFIVCTVIIVGVGAIIILNLSINESHIKINTDYELCKNEYVVSPTDL